MAWIGTSVSTPLLPPTARTLDDADVAKTSTLPSPLASNTASAKARCAGDTICNNVKDALPSFRDRVTLPLPSNVARSKLPSPSAS